MLLTAFICLFAGMGAGLMRAGWSVPWFNPVLTAQHGVLMVSGFLGTLISLERAVAIGYRWTYLAPLVAATGGLILISSDMILLASACMLSASLLLTVASVYLLWRQYCLFQAILALGSMSWLMANLLWMLGATTIQLLPWWLGFLIFTIAGERLELSRFRRPSTASRQLFVFFVILTLCGAVWLSYRADWDLRLLSLALLTLTLWLLKNDIARHAARQSGLTRYIGLCLLSGYGWLFLAAMIGLSFSPLLPGTSYDAFIHCIALGFVFSMIFAHAPVIFPSVINVSLPFSRFFYLPLLLLHLSLMTRVAGDLLIDGRLHQLGAAANVAAIALFILTMLGMVLKGLLQTRTTHAKLD